MAEFPAITSPPFFFQTHAQSSVIQPNQQSVIQTATGNIQPVKSVLLVNSKPNSVIHTTHQAIQVHSGARFNTLVCDGQQQTQKIFSSPQIKPEPNIGHMIDSDGDSDLSDDDSPKKRRDLLTRRPSYRKILNDLGGGEIGKCCENFPLSPSPPNIHKRKSLCRRRVITEWQPRRAEPSRWRDHCSIQRAGWQFGLVRPR